VKHYTLMKTRGGERGVAVNRENNGLP